MNRHAARLLRMTRIYVIVLLAAFNVFLLFVAVLFFFAPNSEVARQLRAVTQPNAKPIPFR